MSLAYGELREKNGQHFVLFAKAKCLQKLREKNGQHSVLLPIHTKRPRNLLQSRSGFLQCSLQCS